jgi:hypothetical protein
VVIGQLPSSELAYLCFLQKSTYLAVQQIEKEVETHDTCLQVLMNSDSLSQTRLSYRLEAGLKTICRSDAYFLMLTTFVWYSVRSFCFSSNDTIRSRVSSVI